MSLPHLPSLLLLLSLLLTSPHGTTTMQKPTTMDPHERETLFQVMDSMSADRNWRSSTPDPCSPAAGGSSSWPGLECDTHLRVTRLEFGTPLSPTCKPTATFPPHVLLLPHLHSLFFSHCFITTRTTLSLPNSNNTTSALKQLSLRSNPALVGPIPPQLFSALPSLQVLVLSQNSLLSRIPQTLSLLTSLVHLDLSYNSLSGPIPARIGAGTKTLMTDLDLSYNSLSGPIPASIGQMSSLQKLDLSSNSLTGRIPESLGSLDLLTFLALSNNRLTGGLPISLPRLQNLQYLLMDNNPMAVPLPFGLGRLGRLQELRLASSGSRGPIPGSLGWLANLTTLSLENNRLTGAIPAALSGLERIYHLNLSKNMLGGVVPFGAGFVRRLGGNLDLSGNPGLCVDGSEGFVGAKVGVGVCGASRRSSGHQAMWGRSSATSSVCCDFAALLLGILGGVGVLLHHWLL